MLVAVVVAGCQTPYQPYECKQSPWLLLLLLQPGPCIGYSEIEHLVHRGRRQAGARQSLVAEQVPEHRRVELGRDVAEGDESGRMASPRYARGSTLVQLRRRPSLSCVSKVCTPLSPT